MGLLGFRRREQELDEEIRSRFHLAVEERVARGEPREEAERAVRREFGNDVRVREVTRMMWGGMWFDRFAQDVRYGIRALRRDPAFALSAAAILTVGIGANAIVDFRGVARLFPRRCFIRPTTTADATAPTIAGSVMTMISPVPMGRHTRRGR